MLLVQKLAGFSQGPPAEAKGDSDVGERGWLLPRSPSQLRVADRPLLLGPGIYLCKDAQGLKRKLGMTELLTLCIDRAKLTQSCSHVSTDDEYVHTCGVSQVCLVLQVGGHSKGAS